MYASYKIIIEIYYSHILVLCLQTLVWVLIPSTSQCEPVCFQCLITTWRDEWLLYQAALSNVKKTCRKLPSWVWIDSRQREVSFFCSHTKCQKEQLCPASPQCQLPLTLQGTSDSAGFSLSSPVDFNCQRAWIGLWSSSNWTASVVFSRSMLSADSLTSVFRRAGGRLICSKCPHITLEGLPREFFLSYDSPFTRVFPLFVQLTHPHDWFIIPKQLTQTCLFLTQVFLRLSFR